MGVVQHNTLDGADLHSGCYIPRAVTAQDFVLTRDGNLHVDGIDASGIVPAGAKAIHILLYGTSVAPNHGAAVQGNQTTKFWNSGYLSSSSSSFGDGAHYVIMCDADRKLDYIVEAMWASMDVTILGWYL